MDILLSILIGICLSAAAGFRIFVPLLVMNIAVQTGNLTLFPGFEWIGSDVALVAFAVATFIEVLAYYIPWLDNLLDTIAVPAAVVAGTVITASLVAEISPFLRWTLAIIAGGGTAGVVQAATSITRLASTSATGGLGNPVVSTAELGAAVSISVLAVAIPVAAIIIVGIIILFLFRKILRRRKYSHVS
jgi:hypothetical protein